MAPHVLGPLPAVRGPGRGHAPRGTLGAELDQLDRLTDEQFVDACLEFTCALPYDEQGAGALTDPGARRRALDPAVSRGRKGGQPAAPPARTSPVS
ncbi:DUF5937 family protein [Streptomyces sp. B21-083]|uniref:DUF5937 family protein n=1 Tax=Streptomyces sp. B21-083 TaxID=3039410 RepID=UPI002FEE9223